MVKENEDYQIIVRLLNDYSQATSTAIHDNKNQMNTKTNDMVTNITNNNDTMSQTTEPIISEKPQLIRQKEVSLNTIMQHDASNSITNNNDNNNSNESNYPNLKNIQPL